MRFLKLAQRLTLNNNEEIRSKNEKERLGKKFKYLTCVAYKNAQQCAFLCVCGCIIKRTWRHLIKYPNGSCGCKAKPGLIKFHKKRRLKIKVGKKINFWTVLENLGLRECGKTTASYFKVQCSCGNIRGYSSTRLFDVKSCGCIRKSEEYLKKLCINSYLSLPIKKVTKIKASIYSNLYSMQEVCEMFEISEKTYQKIKENKTYKYIGDKEE